MERAEAVTRLLDTAEALFYERGVQAVGMDEIRGVSGVSLKRLYQCFPAKEELVVAYLRRRDQRWRESLAGFVRDRDDPDPARRPLLVFDWLYAWFSEPGFRGCAFINSFGELGATSAEIAVVAREHKDALKQYLVKLVGEAGVKGAESVAEQLLLLIDGAITSAAIVGNPDAARHARTAAATLLASVRERA
ncbi:TetR/AcrR family transcriptional regulator [Amycolatopsis taiwanensis]|uniref:TetR family transcriptional regulator n=1 Tax=Amycolatopsis taiwanensis TaxID=342230 RepID=A0A9W6R4Z3_9PSEU|nr:TetR/AcrR family transcriptional regulator [Amycolatopsis taiwanensis]GLY67585.1 TetR family transcriptional regulator [Amycolatopsis taiwanensis]